jgi:ubiquinone/menaquinone biosynthesis C-methylase UbiE
MHRKILVEKIPGPMASIYEKATRMVIDTYYRQVAQEVVLSLKEGVLLDLGTGPGYLPIEIVKASPSIKVDGIDLSHRLISMARANALRAGVGDRAHFEFGDAADLRFADESYDMVLSTGMLHQLKDPAKVLKESCRVLKTGGEAWIYDPAQVSSQIDTQKWKASLSTFEKLMYLLFLLFTLVNPSRTYNRDQVVALIRTTAFREYWIDEKKKEMKIRLRK